jgi:hypothetical protein
MVNRIFPGPATATDAPSVVPVTTSIKALGVEHTDLIDPGFRDRLSPRTPAMAGRLSAGRNAERGFDSRRPRWKESA